MQTSSVMKWSMAAVALVGLGVLVAGSASAAQDDDENAENGLEDTGVRHGVRYEGCEHFELVDPDAVEAWGRSQAWSFAKWVPKLDELREDPEPAIIEAMTLLFPECEWPPAEGTTFGPERLSWGEAMAIAKEAVAELDLAVMGGGDPQAMVGGVIARVLALGMRGQPIGRRRRG